MKSLEEYRKKVKDDESEVENIDSKKDVVFKDKKQNLGSGLLWPVILNNF